MAQCNNPELLVHPEFPKGLLFWPIIKSVVVSFNSDLALQRHKDLVLICLSVSAGILSVQC